MGVKSVWGESNTRAFKEWADYVQKKLLQQKGLSLLQTINYATNKTSGDYLNAKNALINLIQSNKNISVENLYNKMPSYLLQNSSTKDLIMELYFEDYLQIQGQADFARERETNFSLIYIGHLRNERQKQKPPIERVKKNIEIGRSNVDDILDKSWQESGRKLKFEEKSTNKANLNIDLKVSVAKKADINDGVVDIRQTLKQPELPKPKPPVDPIIVNNKIPPVVARVQVDAPIINIIEPKQQAPVVEVKIENVIESTPIIKMTPIKAAPLMEKIDNSVWYGLSSFELYILEQFFGHYKAFVDNDQKQFYLNLKELAKLKGDIIYNENKLPLGIGKKIGLFFCTISIVGIPFIPVALKNKVRTDAIKEYGKKYKNIKIDEIYNEFKNKYPKIIK